LKSFTLLRNQFYRLQEDANAFPLRKKFESDQSTKLRCTPAS
jgi:hypothetical protein